MFSVLDEAFTIAWIQAIEVKRMWVNLVVFQTLFPISLLFLTRYLLPATDSPDPRLVAGTIVLSTGLGSISVLAQVIAYDRLSKRLDLYVTSPISPLSYALGLIVFQSLKSQVTVVVILLLAPLFDFQLHLSFWLPVLALVTAVSLSGVALVIGTWARDIQTANGLANLVGIVLVFVSPVFFPASRLPDWLEPISKIAPYTHAAEALDLSLSGQMGFYDEVAILTVASIAVLAFGLMGMRWQER